MTGTAARGRRQRPANARAAADPDVLRPLVWDRCGAIRRGTHTRLGNLRHLDRRTAGHLAGIGLHTLDDLAYVGPVNAYLRLEETQTPGLTLDVLWAMDGALSGTDPRELPAGRRNELLGELRRVKGRLVRRGRRR
ncbi:TfoX/Sxy family DNA transformation protein [Actinomadura sp. NPDC047616]|uniref:TfoX/Sxy family DNA transformation protein n=1 Tax=Actinomadura sp. NPDC047616 TaxID=3155914 RepID=UPI0033DDA516